MLDARKLISVVLRLLVVLCSGLTAAAAQVTTRAPGGGQTIKPLFHSCPPDCVPVDSMPPQIVFIPLYNQTYYRSHVGVSILYIDHQVNYLGRKETFNGVSVVAQEDSFGSQPNRTDWDGQPLVTWVAYFHLTLQPGQNPLYAYICDYVPAPQHANCGSLTDPMLFVPDTVVAVQKTSRAYPLEKKIASFTVQNTGTGTYSYNVTPSCSGAASGCILVNAVSPISISAGVSRQVDVQYTASSTLQSGTVALLASYAPQPTLNNADTVSVTVRPYAALFTSDSLGVGSVVERDQCLMFSLGSSAAYECGDLRLVHPLPSLRTLGKERAPTLIYNSQHAHPFPIVPSRIALPTGALPDTVYGLLKVDGAFTGDTAKWPGSDWVAGTSRRVTMAFDALTKTSGLHPYSLEVRKGSSTRTLVQIDTGSVAIVNRSASPFGAGWWIAGMESLDPSTKTWIGGDGSVRQYRSAGTNVWVAPNVDHPDTLKFDGTYYSRYLPHGARVKFNATGQHVYTIDRLGYQTVFTYASATSSQLTFLQLPSPLGTYFPQYAFTYASGRLVSVYAPISRTTAITDSAGLITKIVDPDTATVRFGYASTSGTNRIVSRTDPLSHMVTYTYDAGGKVVKDSLNMGTGTAAIVEHFRPAETRGLWRSTDQHAVVPESVFTRVDGPRPVADITNFWLDRFGGPVRVSDALGEETLVYKDAQWPGLAAKLRYDNNRVITSSYDARGNVTASLDSSTFQDSAGVRRYATTRYHWRNPWDYPDSVITAAHVITTFDYDAVGNRTWQQVGADSARRVWFYYYPGLPGGVGLLRATKAPLVARDSLLYSIYGNVYRSRSPAGYWETRVHEASGHDTSDVVAIAAGDTSSATSTTGRLVTSIMHDIMGRVTGTDVTGPPTSYATASRSGTIPQQILRVRNFYNKAGLTDSVQRWAMPDTNHIGISTTKWTRDNADRVLTETTPDGNSTYEIYDEAGNVTRHQGRRATLVYSTYDLLNRLVVRNSPPIFYPDTTIPVYRFPRYGLPTGGYQIPGDTATFTYDNVGNMLTANDGAAHITRRYNANGTLAIDSLRTRTWGATPGDYDQHKYVNQYTYDLAGRRTSLTFPAVVGGGTQQYAYDSITGNLGTVVDVLGNKFTYSYDVAGRMDSLEYPGKIFERSYFDAGGELWRRLEGVYNSFIGTDSGFASKIHDDTLTYDARGKILRSNSIQQKIVNTYSGLGAMTSSYLRDSTAPPSVHLTEEAYEQDALGNNYFSFDKFPGSLGQNPGPEYKKFFYQAKTARQAKTMAGTDATHIIAMADTSLYDHSGNTEYYARVSPVLTADATSTFQRSYYDGLDKLAVAEKFSSDSTSRDGGFEEYRYDALGRRVLRRWRGYWACALPCYNSIERTVWDGNQILAEMRQDGGDFAASLEMDRGASGVAALYYGAVAYTHGGGIDQPLDLIRFDYATPWSSPIALIPHNNWRGVPDLGSYANGTSRSWKLNGGVRDTLRVDWPSKNALATFRTFGTFKYHAWFGSLVTQQRDGSGQMYMRNRYYDPATGRFTQEDPIGLAGGLNAYGFASGDPLSYRDPFGLCKVDVRFKKIGPGYYHAYIVTTAPDNTRTEFRGGPTNDGPSGGSSGALASGSGGASGQASGSNSNSSNSSSPGSGQGGTQESTGPFGAIKATTEPYNEQAVDYETGTPPSVRAVDDDKSCDSYNKQFGTELSQIANRNIPYNPFSTNSNATAHAMLQSAHLSIKAPVWAPGWNETLTP